MTKERADKIESYYSSKKHEHQYTIPVETRIEPLIAYVELGNDMRAIIDAEDLGKMQGRTWGFEGRYAAAGKLYMHHHIMGYSNGKMIDHINQNKLDNRKANLRFVSKGQNTMNSGRSDNQNGFKGVHRKPNGQYYARFYINADKTVNSAAVDTPEEAAKDWDNFVKEYRGAGFYLNFPEPESVPIKIESVTKLRCPCGDEVDR